MCVHIASLLSCSCQDIFPLSERGALVWASFPRQVRVMQPTRCMFASMRVCVYVFVFFRVMGSLCDTLHPPNFPGPLPEQSQSNLSSQQTHRVHLVATFSASFQ